eukprot:1193408-Rhodomonas_salina.1
MCAESLHRASQSEGVCREHAAVGRGGGREEEEEAERKRRRQREGRTGVEGREHRNEPLHSTRQRQGARSEHRATADACPASLLCTHAFSATEA